MNLYYSIIASAMDIGIFLQGIISNKFVSGFASGFILSILVTGLIISKNPRSIPVILRYNKTAGFEKISKQDSAGIYQQSYSKFTKQHKIIRSLFASALALLFAFIILSLMNGKMDIGYISRFLP